jgi:hypothetical protein
MLAISIYSQPGVYALLLGSGVSSAAGILTGHQVTLDLIRQIAASRGESCEPSPEAWLEKTLGIVPSYSDLLAQLAPEPAERAAILTSVEATGSGSEFDEYLETIQRYEARLGPWFEDRPNVQILARNRAGGAVAAEITVGSGTVVCLPPPSDHDEEDALFKGVNAFLGHRFGPGLKWLVKEEEELRAAREKLIGDFQSGTAAVSKQQEAVQERKRAVFAKSQVKRGVGYFDQATRAGCTPRQTMTALYSLIEMLKDYYDTDWSGLADLLEVSHKSVDRIKILANKPEKHMRHVNASDPEGVDQAELVRVIEDAKAIMSSFMTREYANEAAKPEPA